MKALYRLWRDEGGYIISSELVLGAGLLVVGATVGLTTLRDQMVHEMEDVAGAISNLNQSYSFSAVSGHSCSTAGSDYRDVTDEGDEAEGTGAKPQVQKTTQEI